ncbi:RNA polymerase sigma factor region1.1 domain-containing protein [Methylobacterium segetis]|uniref:RNA polymerase sigma factor region1.1 domain-containing protein n=1 Tax=Methylobacterium segetis TaxID=2488750 RepID=UPI00140482C0|nr:RNA polymerase sigma factor region1.1 domain-containing protein [Methylobacterium segetis]
MAAHIDRNTLNLLIAFGKQKGRLSPEDLLAALPMDGLSAEDIALLVLEIEEAGVPVELEETLLTVSRAEGPPSVSNPLALPSEPASGISHQPRELTSATAPSLTTVGLPAQDGSAQPVDGLADRTQVSRIVAVAGFITFLVLAGGVLFMTR